jgi:hypothetical protein
LERVGRWELERLGRVGLAILLLGDILNAEEKGVGRGVRVGKRLRVVGEGGRIGKRRSWSGKLWLWVGRGMIWRWLLVDGRAVVGAREVDGRIVIVVGKTVGLIVEVVWFGVVIGVGWIVVGRAVLAVVRGQARALVEVRLVVS